MKKICTILLILETIWTGYNPDLAHAQDQVPVLNEYMNLNTVTLQDEDGDYPDWIECFNPTDTAIDLTGYGLSDNPKEPFKWVFPYGILQPGQHRLIFASGKDRTNVPDHWETLITEGDTWHYFIGLSQPPDNWAMSDFDDSAWLSGPSPLGYRDEHATILPRKLSASNQTSIFLRTRFTIADANAVVRAFLHLDYEDAFVAYLNGREVTRMNIGSPDTPPQHDETAAAIATKDLEAFDIEKVLTLLVTGENILALQVHSLSPVHHLSALPLLTLGFNKAPDNARGTPDYLNFPTTLHTNFKISADGEPLLLTKPSGDIADRIEGSQSPVDYSWGRTPDGGATWALFPMPTPGAANQTEVLPELSAVVEIDPPGGFHFNGAEVSLMVEAPEARIYYTLNGAEPADSVDMFLYSGPIRIDSTIVVKARAFAPGFLPGKVSTHTYLVGRDFSLPVLSLSTHPDNFFDDKIGIYVKGTNTNYQNQRYKANYGEDWERPVHIEFFEPDGTLGFSIDAGVKIIGLAGRTYPRKGLALFARAQYGYSQIDYRVFPDLPIDQFTALVLRNSGRDQVEHSTLFRDELCQALVEELNFDQMAYRPTLVYINGAYWGIHNLREKQNEDYLAAHHGVNPNQVDILELYHGSPPPIVVEGDPEHYNALIDYITSKDISDPIHYDYLKTQMQMDHFIDYIAAEIYLGNIDWLGNNMKFWRPQTPTGKWRWMLFDIDWGLGRASGGVEHNTLEMATDPNGPRNYPAWTTFLIRHLFNNQEFIEAYANRSADFINSIFLPQRVAQTIDKMKTVLEPELPHHFARWGGDRENWIRNLGEQARYAEDRPFHLRRFIMEKFAISDTAAVQLNIEPPNAGTIKINTLDVDNFPWKGTYFHQIPIQVTALAHPGYRFTGWDGADLPALASNRITLTDDVSLTARFTADSTAFNRIVINEINYNSAADSDVGDWVELYNGYPVAVDVSGWTLMDENDRRAFVIEGRTVLAPGGFLVLCRDAHQFHLSFPQVTNFVGDFGFGFSRNGELIRLFDTRKTLVDSLVYQNTAPWPEAADGRGASLALRQPQLDNALPESWAASKENGTPGRANEVFTLVETSTGDRLPESFSLQQNYPNPFNAETIIVFSLPRASRVQIDLYSSLGQRLETLVGDHLLAGQYKITFKAADLAAGLYFYRMVAEEFEQSKSMLLLK